MVGGDAVLARQGRVYSNRRDGGQEEQQGGASEGCHRIVEPTALGSRTST